MMKLLYAGMYHDISGGTCLHAYDISGGTCLLVETISSNKYFACTPNLPLSALHSLSHTALPAHLS